MHGRRRRASALIFSAAAAAFAASCRGTYAPPGLAADGGPGPLEASPPPRIPKDAQRNAWSAPVAFDWIRGGAWTANGDVGTVSYVDLEARRTVREIPIGHDVRAVALSPDAKWVAAADRQDGAVTLIAADSGTPMRTLAVGAAPRAVVWDPVDPRWAYVALEGDGAVAIVDRTAGAFAGTVAVGRLPVGLAVSKFRHELYVTHRVDPHVVAVDLDASAIVADVPLASQPFTTPTAPRGAPFAFEGLALTTDGLRAWIPHELLAPTRPFVFDRTIFPAVSVVDLFARSELVDQRMNLFDAINLVDSTSQPVILSQPCAVAMHPNGLVAYALACGSEDLLTFDMTGPRAVDVIRALPGDHPTGLVLDDTGQRALVLFEQSHTLATVDTSGGNPVGHATPYGEPIPLVAKDPVDPELRAGLTLFYRASSAKGALATTGNNWMSCGGCHLDGFGASNAGFFAAFQPDMSVDGRVGHSGMKDLFSSVPDWSTDAFDPHDVLTALIEQGGLAPDRRGASRDGQIDPSAPTAEAARMAQRLARVVAKDLPVGPSWMRFPAGEQASAFDGVWCGGCHEKQYAAWAKGAHAHSAGDPLVVYAVGVERAGRGPQYSRLCAGCHDPTSARMGETSFTTRRGVTCLGCHDVERAIGAGGNGDYVARNHDWSNEHAKWGKESLAFLRKPEFCATCHEEFIPSTGLRIMKTAEEWATSPASATKVCVDCHMPKSGGASDHRVLGANVPMARWFGDADLARAEESMLAGALALAPTRQSDRVTVSVTNVSVGHGFPGAIGDLREPWVELQALDAQKNVLARWGGPGADGVLPASAARLAYDVADEHGTVLLRHDLSEMSHMPYYQRVPAAGARVVSVPLPAGGPPAGTAELDAVLHYRTSRTTYWRAATGDGAGAAPAVEVARAVVP